MLLHTSNTSKSLKTKCIYLVEVIHKNEMTKIIKNTNPLNVSMTILDVCTLLNPPNHPLQKRFRLCL